MIRISNGLKNCIKSFVISLLVVVALYCIGALPALFFNCYFEYKMWFNLIMFWLFASVFIICVMIIIYLVLREVFYDFVIVSDHKLNTSKPDQVYKNLLSSK